VNSLPAQHPPITLPACQIVIHNALRKNRRNILIKAVVGISGALITPILISAVATLMMFYIVIWIIVVGSADVALRIGAGIFAVWVLFYLGLMVVAWKREWVTRNFFYQSSERRPPTDIFPRSIPGPIYYIPLGMDLLQDDVPPHWLVRIPCFWADILVKARLQWKVYRFAANEDHVSAAQIILAIAQAPGASIDVDPLMNHGMTKPQIHAALCTLMILDLAALNTDWSKVWLNRAVREQLGLPPDHGKNRK
jgi:hypothetical protein